MQAKRNVVFVGFTTSSYQPRGPQGMPGGLPMTTGKLTQPRAGTVTVPAAGENTVGPAQLHPGADRSPWQEQLNVCGVGPGLQIVAVTVTEVAPAHNGASHGVEQRTRHLPIVRAL